MAQLLVNTYNLGTDLEQVILVPDQGPNIALNRIGHLEDLSFTQEVTKNTITPVLYKGTRLHRNIYHDFIGELTITRFNNDMTSLVVGIMDRFRRTGAETYFTLFCTLSGAANGPQEEMAALRCVLADHKIGPFSGTAEVKAPLSFRCQTLILPNSRDVLTSGPTAG